MLNKKIVLTNSDIEWRQLSSCRLYHVDLFLLNLLAVLLKSQIFEEPLSNNFLSLEQFEGAIKNFALKMSFYMQCVLHFYPFYYIFLVVIYSILHNK
jgi:hypothetical protein